MANDASALLAQLARYRPALIVIVTAIAAFTFSAIDDRDARHRAGITDACAREQAAERLFPITRCPTQEEMEAYLARLGLKPLLPRMSDYFPEGDIPKDDPRYIDCDKLEADRPSLEAKPGPDYLLALLAEFDCERQKKQQSELPNPEEPRR
jgi:hypothetical protein